MKVSISLNHQVKSCNDCQLNSPKSLSWGDKTAKIMFIGINPSQKIEADRLCFQSNTFGKMFQALEELGADTKDYFYTNIIRCATPDNREPDEGEILSCSRFLDQEITKVNPRKIVCLGKFVGAQFNIADFYTGVDVFKLGQKRTAYLLPHPTFVNRFPANYEKFKKYLGYIIK